MSGDESGCGLVLVCFAVALMEVRADEPTRSKVKVG